MRLLVATTLLVLAIAQPVAAQNSKPFVGPDPEFVFSVFAPFLETLANTGKGLDAFNQHCSGREDFLPRMFKLLNNTQVRPLRNDPKISQMFTSCERKLKQLGAIDQRVGGILLIARMVLNLSKQELDMLISLGPSPESIKALDILPKKK